MKKIPLLIIALAFLPFKLVYSQHVLLEEDVRKYQLTSNDFGPNQKNFGHLYIGGGFMAMPSSSETAKIVYGKSNQFVIGYRYKLKLNEHLAVGSNLAFHARKFEIDQKNATKTFPDNRFHEEESLHINAFSLEPYFRINFGRRGNMVGRFLDIGAYGQYNYRSKHIYTDNYEATDVYAEQISVINFGLKYVEPLEYGANARIGNNNFVIYAQYRLSQLVLGTPFPNTLDLPPLIVGVQFGIHK